MSLIIFLFISLDAVFLREIAKNNSALETIEIFRTMLSLCGKFLFDAVFRKIGKIKPIDRKMRNCGWFEQHSASKRTGNRS